MPREPLVCSSPAGGIWLLLEEKWGKYSATGGATVLSRWLNLETGEDRWMQRSAASLMNWGWRKLSGDTDFREIEGV